MVVGADQLDPALEAMMMSVRVLDRCSASEQLCKRCLADTLYESTSV